MQTTVTTENKTADGSTGTVVKDDSGNVLAQEASISKEEFEKALEEGNLIGIFIEGTRSKDGEFLPPKNGVSLIAWDTKTPVIPICHTAINGRFVMHYGKPLSLEDMGFDKGGAREFRNASRVIMDHIKALREEDLAAAGVKNNG